MKCGFIGLGVMGSPMACHLVDAGNEVWVWNRTPSKMERAVSKGAHPCANPADVASNVEMLFCCVGRTEDVHECLVGSDLAAAKGAQKGTLFVDHSTIAPDGAKAIYTELASKGITFVDAPITGGSAGAEAGKLTVFLGGDPEPVGQAIETIKPYTKTAAHVGPAGYGQKMKLANQIAVGGALAGLCECLAFAEKAGLDLAQTRTLIGSGAGGSWAFENYGPKILNRDWSPGFSIKNQRKDFGYCKESAKSLEASIPFTELVDTLLGEIQSRGLGEQTTAILFEYLEKGG